jgi:hypothetical protein
MPTDRKPPPLRTFGLNSREFHEFITPPPEPHMWGPGLPRDRRSLEMKVLVEGRDGSLRAVNSGEVVRVAVEPRAKRT